MQYPPLPPDPPPPPPVQRPPNRRPLAWLVLILALLLCVFVSSPDFRQGFAQGLKPMLDAQNNVQQSETATAFASTPPAPEWTITHSFSGTGSSKTATFAVNGDWQLNWYCALPSSGMIQANISIDIDRPGQKTPLVPYAVDASCSTSVFSGSTEEHQTGTLYLAVTADTQWRVDIEELL